MTPDSAVSDHTPGYILDLQHSANLSKQPCAAHLHRLAYMRTQQNLTCPWQRVISWVLLSCRAGKYPWVVASTICCFWKLYVCLCLSWAKKKLDSPCSCMENSVDQLFFALSFRLLQNGLKQRVIKKLKLTGKRQIIIGAPKPSTYHWYMWPGKS